jgi:hypothetical protein
MITFNDWLKNKHPEIQSENILDWGKKIAMSGA